MRKVGSMRHLCLKSALRCLLVALPILLANVTPSPLAQGAPATAPEEVTILHGAATVEVERFGEILSLVEQNYVAPVQIPDLVYRAIDGMVQGVEEPEVTLEGTLAELRIASDLYSTVLRTDPDARNWQEYLEMFGKALTFLKIYPLDGDDARASELAQLAIDHMLSGLDPHTHSLTPEEFEEVQSETSGEYGGVGIEISLKQGRLTVVSTFEGTPANLAGIQSGDQIVGIAGEPTDDMTLFDAVRRVRGKEGTSVILSIMREGLSTPQEYTVQREIIHIVSVSHRSLGDEVAFIRIRTFNKSTNEELGAALRALRNDDSKGVILDLRGNPGGLLEESIDVAGRFLRKGQLVVETRSRVPDQNIKFVNRHRRGLSDRPLVVLVDRGSASASEIVASALQDYRRALIVGETTFGKGTVQTIIPLSDGSALRLTVANYYSPRGREIQDVGVWPDVVVESHIGSRLKEKLNPPPDRGDEAKSAAASRKIPLLIRLEDRDDLELVQVFDESDSPSDDLVLALAKTILTRIEPEAIDEYVAHPARLLRLVMKEEKYVRARSGKHHEEYLPAPASGK